MGIPHMRQLALPNPSVEGVQSVTDDYSLIIARIDRVWNEFCLNTTIG